MCGPFVQKMKSFALDALVVGQSLRRQLSITRHRNIKHAVTNQKNNLRVSFLSPEIGIKPAQDGPASNVTARQVELT